MNSTTHEKRTAVLMAHLSPDAAPATTQGAVEADECGASSFCTKTMYKLLEHDNFELKESMKDFLKDPFYRPRYDITKDEYRELNWERVKRAARAGFISVDDIKNNRQKFLAFQEFLCYGDPAMAVKCGVHLVLCTGSVVLMGTKRHDKFLRRLGNLSLPGSFGMTELGHGSNVQGVETTAHYDPSTQEFVIHTPNDYAQKAWIGNAAKHGQICTVFAQLFVDGKHQGVHAFLVPIRNPDGTHCKGVRTRDHGHKIGLNGVDNGRIWFNKVRIPRENLLNRFGDVKPDGTYVSAIKSKVRRFAATVGVLVGGRIAVSLAANVGAKIGLTVAIRYALQRPQFGPRGRETLLMDYVTHQRRLLPYVAHVYAYAFALNEAKEVYANATTDKDNYKVHLLASGLKAETTWNKTFCLQECREACGGQGFSSHNRIGVLRAESDVDLTYEGDNTVLLMQLARPLLKQLAQGTLPPAKNQRDVATDDVRSVAFLRGAMRHRVNRLVQTLGARFMKGQGAGKSIEQIFLEEQDMVIRVSRAEVARIVVDIFAKNAAKAPSSVKSVLDKVFALHALHEIEKDLGTFLVYKTFGPDMGKRVQAEVTTLSKELRPHAASLVDSFGIPDHLVNALIAKDNYIQYFSYEAGDLE